MTGLDDRSLRCRVIIVDEPAARRCHVGIAVSPLASQIFAAMMAAVVQLACGRGPVDLPIEGPTVDPQVYALGFCSFKCYRLDQCGLTGGIPKQTCEQTCIDDALDTLPTDPCWAEQIELRRCIVRETTCDGVTDEELPPGSETACEHREQALSDCGS